MRMHAAYITIAAHTFRCRTDSRQVRELLVRRFGRGAPEADGAEEAACEPMRLVIHTGYGEPFAGYDVAVRRSARLVRYERRDYRISIDWTGGLTVIDVFDEFALRHALMNWYSAYIAAGAWGLLMHASCVVEDAEAQLFAGPSGAGKSTVARLSQPRPVLADEAAIVQPTDGGAMVYDSPFRSELEAPAVLQPPQRLGAIHLLRQSAEVRRERLARAAGMTELPGKVFYWAARPQDTARVLALTQQLVRRVPIYTLHFQKNDSFWEVIQDGRLHLA
ncbi:hypothetical protein IDH44_26030 [Paenibacillus sp. IB182496]|uniref:Uncharacterized protein n=1 Tax=Paenibacillus sabuli TaxID=2772509 RepID=A0A927C019_9BACL|nr:hypothetical protein [Paenibacillus sabuli]MBD2848644.1 hypothetical protein [Paenibacillus sabuli]